MKILGLLLLLFTVGVQSAANDAWITSVLTQLSPKVAEMGTRILNSRVEPLVQGALSALNLGKKAFRFTRINLGQVKPQIQNVRTHHSIRGLNRITVDFDLVYQGDLDVQVSILGSSSGVRNVQVKGRMRMVLAPTMSELPLIGGVQLFFLNKPQIDFTLDGVARIAEFPRVKAKIIEELMEDLNKQAVYPNRVTIPLSWTADPQMVWQPQVSGILGIKLKSVKGLPRRGGMRKLVGQDKPDVYGTIGLGGQEWRTRVVKNSIQANWEEWYEFPLELLDGHLLEINLYDYDSSSSDEFLGYCSINVNTFMKRHALATNQPQRGAQQTPNAVPVEPHLIGKSVEKLVALSASARKTKYETIQGNIEAEYVWTPLTTVPGPATARLYPGSTAAVLTFFVYSANNLAKYGGATKFKAGHQPSPQLNIVVANNTIQSEIARNTQQASFNFGKILSLQDDWKTKSLLIKVDDTEQRGSFGQVEIPLSSLVGADKDKEMLPLLPNSPSQTLTLAVKIRFPAPI